MPTRKHQQLTNAFDQMQAFVLKHQEGAIRSGHNEAWERDWQFVQTARPVIDRFDYQELRRFMDVDVRGLGHYFGAYADDREVGIVLDTLYQALREAIGPEPHDNPEQLGLK